MTAGTMSSIVSIAQPARSAAMLERTAGLLPAVSAVAGLGAAGAGLVPLNVSDLHGIFALLAFLFFNIEARVVATFGAIGQGGAERMIVYPVMLWMLAFGGYLMAVRPDRTIGSVPDRERPQPDRSR